MKITIDTVQKTMVLEDIVNLAEFIESISFIPNWKEYKLVPKYNYTWPGLITTSGTTTTPHNGLSPWPTTSTPSPVRFDGINQNPATINPKFNN